MAKTRRQHDEDAWRHAKRVCRLSARQVEMARTLGMNPKKLPGLRPSPQQRWKRPVGEFIEELYEKRFGGTASHDDDREPTPGTRTASPSLDAWAPDVARDPSWQARDLIDDDIPF